ncbi:sensor histidine kinase [Cellulosimicrobium protaetiae]|uniref:histidine kinase n=1 Tax=Cellulosimicrobium protaetiae TaxID=2587808 RepID=A0A6M5UKA7_9MICO|nr:sensor histidine kinase [Cellulosimicrobium protaetiae]QJW37972.1 sensor histidine kinase [Cellulosimicrobium protaetiae]
MTETVRRALDRVGVRTDTGRDAVLAGVVAAATVVLFLGIERVLTTDVGSTFGAGPGAVVITPGVRAAVLVLVVGQAATLTVRRRAPLTCLALAVAAQVAITVLLPPYVGFQAPATLVAAYSAGAYAARPARLGGPALAAAAQVVLVFALGGFGVPAGTGPAQQTLQVGGALVSALLTFVGAALVGSYVATRRELVAGLRDRVRHAEREREALAAQAVLEERARMARELHDVAAHHLSGIVVQAAAAERLVDADPDRAKESVRWIRAQGRETLDDLRLVVGILRGRDEGDGAEREAPQPTLAEVPALLDTAREAGTTATVETEGSPWDLTPSAQIAVYRVLQEALANARRHAPGRPVAVRFVWSDADVVLSVRNPAARTVPPPGTRPGHGLVGMRERAAVLGGTLDARRTPDGAWVVRLTVPRAPAREQLPSGPLSTGAPAAPAPTDQEVP